MESAPDLTLVVVTSADGYMGNEQHQTPQSWASEEEQALFFRNVEAADWAFMGRLTHEFADRPDRHRVIFSSKYAGWRRPTQFWINPEGMNMAGIAALISDVRPLKQGVILGGTRVHDWFLANDAIHRVHLTVEPLTLHEGFPVLSDSAGETPLEIFTRRGFTVVEERQLNAAGTEYYVLAHERLDTT